MYKFILYVIYNDNSEMNIKICFYNKWIEYKIYKDINKFDNKINNKLVIIN